MNISTHALTWSATFNNRAGVSFHVHFNSRTHVECDVLSIPRILFPVISTHALTWSATPIGTRSASLSIISTHALTWSATLLKCAWLSFSKISTHALTWSATQTMPTMTPPATFQLTHSRGVRRRRSCSMICGTIISTHALTWSATARRSIKQKLPTFQLTHSRGVRLSMQRIVQLTNNFNSRTHVECDRIASPPTHSPFISTHALTWSATIYKNKITVFYQFQLTHSRGVRLGNLRRFHSAQ